jgi:mersacidin/lichenicidin family type 2 lantibiotic
MTSDEIVRSWKNDDYRLSLSLDDQALLPENPAGLSELSDAELFDIDGGSDTIVECSAISKIFSVVIVSLTGNTPVSIALSKLIICSPSGN